MKTNNLKQLCIIVLTAVFLLAVSRFSLAAEYNCATTGTFNSEYNQLKTKKDEAEARFNKIKEKYKSKPTSEEIAIAQKELFAAKTKLKEYEQNILDADKKLESPKEPAPGKEKFIYNKNITNLTNNIESIQAKIKGLAEKIKLAQEEARKSDPQKVSKLLDYIQANVNPLAEQVQGLMPSTQIPARMLNSEAVHTWIQNTKQQVKNAPDANNLTSKQLTQYNYFADPQIKQLRGQLHAQLQYRDQLLANAEANRDPDAPTDLGIFGTAGSAAWDEYYNKVPAKINQLTADLHTAIANAKAKVDRGINSVEVKRDELVTKEKKVYGKHQELITKLHGMQDEHEKLKQDLIDKSEALKAAVKKYKDYWLKVIKDNKKYMADVKKEIFDQDAKVKNLEQGKDAWFRAEKEHEIADRNFAAKDAQKLEFETRVAIADSNQVGKAKASLKAAVTEYKNQRQKLENAVVKLRQALDKRKAQLQNQARQLKRAGKYTKQAKADLVREWQNYKNAVNERMQNVRTRAKNLRSKFLSRLGTTRNSLQAYDCADFPKVTAYLSNVRRVINNISGQAPVQTVNVVGFRMPLPAVTEVNFRGSWNSKYGCTEFRQSGNKVRGKINYKNGNLGYLNGTLQDQTLYFSWRNKAQRGTGRLTMSPDGAKLSGGFKRAKGGGDSWYLTKRYGTCPAVKKPKAKQTNCPVCREKCVSNCLSYDYGRANPRSCHDACNLCPKC